VTNKTPLLSIQAQKSVLKSGNVTPDELPSENLQSRIEAIVQVPNENLMLSNRPSENILQLPTEGVIHDGTKIVLQAGKISSMTWEQYWKLFRRRMWTRRDWAHLHAISGVLYLFPGLAWVAYMWYQQALYGGAALMEPGPISFAILFAGVVNCVTSLPMAYLKPSNVEGADIVGDAFRSLGVGVTGNCIWLSFWFSGSYPNWLHVLDKPIGAVSLAAIFWGIWVAEASLTETLKELDEIPLERRTERKWDHIINHKIGSYPNLFNVPCIANIMIGGTQWYSEVLTRFPQEHLLLFHGCFGLGCANSAIFLWATMYGRKLMTLRQWLWWQLIAFVPFITTCVDLQLYGDKVSINPFEMYTGLMSL